MAKALNINPNRMELSRLKRRIVVAKRGHKLLKDKQDALIKEFLQKARGLREQRNSVEVELLACYQSFQLARAQSLPAILEQSLMSLGGETQVSVQFKNVLSVDVPTYELPQRSTQLNYGLASSSGALDMALEKFNELKPKLIALAAAEKTLKLMALEIERTRRRVNALEHVMIPSFKEAIRDISMKLEEAERSVLSRLMVVKEIVRAH